MKKLPIAKRLVRDGYFTTDHDAAAWVMSGQVYIKGQKAKGGQMVGDDDVIDVRGRDLPYTSKGGLKLEGAIRDFGIDVKDRVCVDAGASTGGFTDCLVKHGAKTVYAVDVGFGQLVGSLRQNEHVVNLERTNVSDEKLLTLSPKPTLGSVDVSYLSLRKAIPYFAEILHHEGELMCLVKPLFEIDDAEARRTGTIAPDQYEPLLHALIKDVNALPYATAQALTHSPVTGNTGTREFFLHVVLSDDKKAPAPDLTEQVKSAVARAEELEEYKK